MPTDAEAIERALDQVGHALSAPHDLAYFRNHRARYASDAATLSQFHDGGTVLEIGSVPGHFTAVLSVLGFPAVGVDLAPVRMQNLCDRFDLDVRRCDVEREPLPFDDARLRHVLCNEVFEHLRMDPLYTLSQINRVLKADGHLLLTTPNLYSVQQILRYLAGRGFGDPLAEFAKLRLQGHMGHVREYSHREMRRFLANAGFEVERAWFRHYYFGGGRRGLAKRVAFTLVPARWHTFQVFHARKARDVPALTPLPGG